MLIFTCIVLNWSKYKLKTNRISIIIWQKPVFFKGTADKFPIPGSYEAPVALVKKGTIELGPT